MVPSAGASRQAVRVPRDGAPGASCWRYAPLDRWSGCTSLPISVPCSASPGPPPQAPRLLGPLTGRWPKQPRCRHAPDRASRLNTQALHCPADDPPRCGTLLDHQPVELAVMSHTQVWIPTHPRARARRRPRLAGAAPHCLGVRDVRRRSRAGRDGEGRPDGGVGPGRSRRAGPGAGTARPGGDRVRYTARPVLTRPSFPSADATGSPTLGRTFEALVQLQSASARPEQARSRSSARRSRHSHVSEQQRPAHPRPPVLPHSHPRVRGPGSIGLQCS
jgi:hypothetical protein